MMEKMAIVTPGFLPVPAVDGGAVETLITYIIEGNEENPHLELTVYTCANEKLDNIHYQHAQIIQIPDNGIRRFISLVAHGFVKYLHIGKEVSSYHLYLKHVNWSRYDKILIENSMRCYEVVCHCRGTNEKLIYHMHNDIEGKNDDKSIERTNLVVKTANRILTCSKYIKKQVMEVQRTDNIRVLYNCVDMDSFKSNPEKANELREKLGYTEDDFIVMYSGRIVPEKGVLELTQAMRDICLEHKEVKLLIVGCCWFPNVMEGEYLDNIYHEIESYKEQVIMTGYIPMKEMPAYYEMSSVLVVPSLWEEPFGMISIESQAMGTPVIVTDSGGLSETVDEKCAIIIDKECDLQKNINNAILKIYNDNELYETMKYEAKMHIGNKKEFQKNNYFEQFIEEINNLTE